MCDNANLDAADIARRLLAVDVFCEIMPTMCLTNQFGDYIVRRPARDQPQKVCVIFDDVFCFCALDLRPMVDAIFDCDVEGAMRVMTDRLRPGQAVAAFLCVPQSHY